jgi:transcriptional regulator with XRE-family HTH domain
MAVDFSGLQEKLRRRLLTEIEAGELSGAQLAQQIGFRQSHISNFLNRKRGLSLEAMDAILKARRLSLEEMIENGEKPRPVKFSIRASSSEPAWIPLVEDEKCLASDVPYSGSRNALKVMVSGLEKLPERMHIPRPHWRRFIAVRVSATDSRAMAPRLRQGALAIVDRHCNTLLGNMSMYLARNAGKYLIRYVEQVGEELILRAHNPEHPVQMMERTAGRDLLAAIIGRVCMVAEEV